MLSPLQSRSYSDGEFVPQTFGSNGGSVPCNPSRLTPHAPISMVDKKPKDFSPLSSASNDFGDTEVCLDIKDLDVIQISYKRSSIGGLFLPQDCHDRCVIGGLFVKDAQPTEHGRRNSEGDWVT